MIGDKWERNTVYKIYIFQVTSSKNHGNHQHNTFQAKLERSFLKGTSHYPQTAQQVEQKFTNPLCIWIQMPLV